MFSVSYSLVFESLIWEKLGLAEFFLGLAEFFLGLI